MNYNKNRNKKGAIEMSLNLIIMLIIGLTVLALVISFVNKLINQGSTQFDEQLTKAEEGEAKLVLESKDSFDVGPKNFKIPSGGKKTFFIKITNPTSGTISFNAKSPEGGNIIGDDLVVSSEELSGGSGLTFKGTNVDLSEGCKVNIQTTPLSVEPKGKGLMRVILTANKECNKGESFFITVKFNPVEGVVKTKQISLTIS